MAELQEILAMGQSTISTHLSQLKQAGLVEDRRTGKSNLLPLATAARGRLLDEILAEPRRRFRKPRADQAAMRRVLQKAPGQDAQHFSTAWPGGWARTTFRASRGRAWPRRCCG